jgi:hypothetical protein
MVRLKFHGTVAALKQKFMFCDRMVHTMCLNFGRTIDESELAMRTATCRFRFANLERFVFLRGPGKQDVVQPRLTTCHPAICHMRQVTFGASVHLILLITYPVIMEMQVAHRKLVRVELVC